MNRQAKFFKKNKNKMIAGILGALLLSAFAAGCGCGDSASGLVSDVTETVGVSGEIGKAGGEAIGGSEKTTTGEAEPVEVTGEAESLAANETGATESAAAFSTDIIPTYTGNASSEINGNIPYFTQEEMTTLSFEFYSPLDTLGRCGVCYACVGRDIMPTKARGEIGTVKPTGWHTVKYNDVIEDNYLYNRCHLIGYCLTGENANEQNLITGTRYMNVEGMASYENRVADYVAATDNHVLYRVTPVFEGSDLVARGVLMEAKSVEDNGEGLSFCVFCHNVQPGIVIDYATGESALAKETMFAEGNMGQGQLSGEAPAEPSQEQKQPKPEEAREETSEQSQPAVEGTKPAEQPAAPAESGGVNYILNTNTKKFHYPYCSSVNEMKEKNKQEFGGSRDEAIAMGYAPCKRCKP